jgi:glycosyltransferase involved in cell wall biosynthesis
MGDLMDYKVSIVIPVYNVEKYIRPCIESALNQTLREIEIICVDDGSTDGCPQILDEYAARDDRVKVVHKPNAGYGQTMNVGMDMAGGEYFAILESDDVVKPRMYETLYTIAANRRADIVKADFCKFALDNGRLNQTPVKIADRADMYGCALSAKDDALLTLRKALPYTWAGIYRRAFLYENGIRHNETPGASYQDNGFWFQTIAMADSVLFHDEAFYMLRCDNPDSSIYNRNKVYCIRDEYEFIDRYLAARPEKVSGEIMQCYWSARFSAYYDSFMRIDQKFRKEFLEHFSEVFLNAMKELSLDSAYYTADDWSMLQAIVSEPDKFLRKYNLFEENKARGRIESVVKRVQWNLEENGLEQTARLCASHLKAIAANCLLKYRAHTKGYRLKAIQENLANLDKQQTQLASDMRQLILDAESELLWADTYYAQKSAWRSERARVNRSDSAGYSFYAALLEALDARPRRILVVGESSTLSILERYAASERADIVVLKNDEDWFRFIGNRNKDEAPPAEIPAQYANDGEMTLTIFDGLWAQNANAFPQEVMSAVSLFLRAKAPFVMLLSDCASPMGRAGEQAITRSLARGELPFERVEYRGMNSTKLWYSPECERLRTLSSVEDSKE